MCVSRWLVSKNLVRTKVEASVSCWQEGDVRSGRARIDVAPPQKDGVTQRSKTDRRCVVALEKRAACLGGTSRDDVAVALRYVVVNTLARSTARPRRNISFVVWRRRRGETCHSKTGSRDTECRDR